MSTEENYQIILYKVSKKNSSADDKINILLLSFGNIVSDWDTFQSQFS